MWGKVEVDNRRVKDINIPILLYFLVAYAIIDTVLSVSIVHLLPLNSILISTG